MTSPEHSLKITDLIYIALSSWRGLSFLPWLEQRRYFWHSII